MSNKSIRMVELKQLLRLHHQGMSSREIQQHLRISRTTVLRYIGIYKDKSLNYEQTVQMSDAQLEALFIDDPSGSENEKHNKLYTYFAKEEKELKSPGVTLQQWWTEYKAIYPDGFSYPHFCWLFRAWRKQSEVTMHIEHKAGDKMFVDYTGKKLQITDRKTGQTKEVEVLVSILGSSQLIYVEATYTQQKEDFIYGVQNALWYFGGTPKAIVTDNLKTAVTKSCKYEPKLNETFSYFALHYGTTILPTRSYKPRDKALVEGAVKIVYQRIFALLRKQTFYNIGELNKAIRKHLEHLNTKAFSGRDYGRKQLFEETEKSHLNPLPAERYELKEFALATVQKNGHIWFGQDSQYYSVPYQYVGKKVKVAYTQRVVEIYHSHNRIAFHTRSNKAGRYSTLVEHMASTHRFVSEWNPDTFINWAAQIGQFTKTLIVKILNQKHHPEQGYKACLGILSFAKKTGPQRLENACKRAVKHEAYGYSSIKKMLENGVDRIEDEQQTTSCSLPEHANIRGADYYH